MWVTDRHNMTLAFKVALNPNTTNGYQLCIILALSPMLFKYGFVCLRFAYVAYCTQTKDLVHTGQLLLICICCYVKMSSNRLLRQDVIQISYMLLSFYSFLFRIKIF